MRTVSNRFSYLFFALLLGAFYPLEAFAFFVDPVPDDVSLKLIIAQLFAGAMPGAWGAGGQDPLATMLGVFNGGILIVGGIIAAYTLIVGTMQTAHDGEMLGKQWSSMWVPIRTVFGIGLVIPMGSGYCVAQLLVMWLTVQSVGLADSLWSAFVGDYLQKSAVQLTAPTPDLRTLASNALKIQVCMNSVDKMLKDNPSGVLSGTTLKITDYSPSITNAVLGKDQIKGKHYGTTSEENLCGTIERQWPTEWSTTAALAGGATGGASGATAGATGAAVLNVIPGGGQVAWGAATAVGGVIGAVTGALSAGFNGAADTTPLITAHMTATDALMSEMDVIAKKIVANEEPDPALFDKALENYQTTIKDAALAYAGGSGAALQSLVDNADKNGWALAGAWYARIASFTNQLNTAVRAVNESSFNSKAVLENSQGATEYAVIYNDSAAKYINKSATALVLGQTIDLGVKTQVKSEFSSGSDDESEFSKKLIKSFSGLDIGRLANDPRHPLIVVQEIGDSILAWVAKGTIGMAAISFFGVGALVAPLLGIVVFAGLAAGVVMAIYTPMLPFILFLGAVLGWAILVIEAMLAAPLWAIMHLVPTGNDFMGSARSGYQLLLSLLLRPALIVLGFAAAVIVIWPFGYILNAVFFDTFLMSMGEQGTVKSFFTTIGAAVIYAGILVSILHKAFSLIHVVPDQILRWIGGGGDGMIGQSAKEMSGDSRTYIAGMATISNSAGNAAGTAGREARNLWATQRNANTTQREAARNKAAALQGAEHSADSASVDADRASVSANSTGRAEDHLEALKANNTAASAHTNAAELCAKSGDSQGSQSHSREASVYQKQAQSHQQALSAMGYEPGNAAAMSSRPASGANTPEEPMPTGNTAQLNLDLQGGGGSGGGGGAGNPPGGGRGSV